jgi:hypothetical protein
MKYKAELYDDRDPEHVIDSYVSSNADDAWDEARRMRDMFRDPDDGVYPVHLCIRVREVSNETKKNK